MLNKMSKNPFENLTNDQQRAIGAFMVNTLESYYPNHQEYPYEKMKEILETHSKENSISCEEIFFQGKYLDLLKEYGDYTVKAFGMKYSIEIFLQSKIYTK